MCPKGAQIAKNAQQDQRATHALAGPGFRGPRGTKGTKTQTVFWPLGPMGPFGSTLGAGAQWDQHSNKNVSSAWATWDPFTQRDQHSKNVLGAWAHESRKPKGHNRTNIHTNMFCRLGPHGSLGPRGPAGPKEHTLKKSFLGARPHGDLGPKGPGAQKGPTLKKQKLFVGLGPHRHSGAIGPTRITGPKEPALNKKCCNAWIPWALGPRGLKGTNSRKE